MYDLPVTYLCPRNSTAKAAVTNTISEPRYDEGAPVPQIVKVTSDGRVIVKFSNAMVDPKDVLSDLKSSEGRLLYAAAATQDKVVGQAKDTLDGSFDLL